MNENVTSTGTLNVKLTDAFGNVKVDYSGDNLIVDSGLQLIARRLGGTTTGTSAAMSHMAIGTGNIAASSLDTTLNTEVARVALTSTTTTNNSNAYIATFGAGVPSSVVDIKEAGILNASSAGVLLNRATFPTITKGTSDTLTITWNVKQN